MEELKAKIAELEASVESLQEEKNRYWEYYQKEKIKLENYRDAVKNITSLI